MNSARLELQMILAVLTPHSFAAGTRLQVMQDSLGNNTIILSLLWRWDLKCCSDINANLKIKLLVKVVIVSKKQMSSYSKN